MNVMSTWRQRARNLYDRLATYEVVDEGSPTDAEQAFAAANASFWHDMLGDLDSDQGHVLVEVHHIAYLTHYIASMARIASAAKGFRPLALTLPNQNIYPGTVLRSYGMDWVDIGRVRYLRFLAEARWMARRVFRQLRTPEDVLHLSVDDMPVGDLIYDEILRFEGYATLDAVDVRVWRALRTFFLYRAMARFILAHYPLRMMMVSHHVGLYPGVFVRYLLQADVPVLYCRSASRPTLYKFTSRGDVHRNVLRPDAHYLTQAKRSRADVLPAARSFLERRFNQEDGDPDAREAFNQQHRTYRSRNAFARDYGLSAARKNVFVMLHAFNDFPHFQGAPSILYRDYYHWFKATLRVARENRSVNWIFKEHPVARFYRTQDLDLKALFEEMTEEHICFLDRDADFNPRSLQDIADAVVTCRGTAGLEYSAVGVPCVLGGQSAYSGFGFTHEPSTPEAYEQALRQIQNLAPLSQEEREQAMLVLYYQLRMIRHAPFRFLPDPDYFHGRFKELDISRGTNLDDFWEGAAKWLSHLDNEGARHEVMKLARLIEDDARTQYLDMEQYPFVEAWYGKQIQALQT